MPPGVSGCTLTQDYGGVALHSFFCFAAPRWQFSKALLPYLLDRMLGKIHLEQAGSRQGRRGRRGRLRAGQAGFSQGRRTPGRASEECRAIWHHH